MPTYDYKCDSCSDAIEEFRFMSQCSDVEPCKKCPDGKLILQMSCSATILMDQKMPEAVQWWKPDPKSPNGCKVFKHKNKYYGGGIGNGKK